MSYCEIGSSLINNLIFMTNYFQHREMQVDSQKSLSDLLHYFKNSVHEFKFVATTRRDASRALFLFDPGTKHSLQAHIELSKQPGKFLAAGSLRMNRGREVIVTIDSDSCKKDYGYEGPENPDERAILIQAVRDYMEDILQKNA